MLHYRKDRQRAFQWSRLWFPGQALLRAECNPHSRTDYFATNAALFALPGIITLYIAGIKLCAWLLRPAALFVMPQLAENAFFSHKAHDRTNALCVDVRSPFLVLLGADCPIVCARARIQARCFLQVAIGLVEVCAPVGASVARPYRHIVRSL
jgi:hypothetical protein